MLNAAMLVLPFSWQIPSASFARFFFFLAKDAVIYTETTKLKALGLATQPEALQESQFSVTGYCLLLQVP